VTAYLPPFFCVSDLVTPAPLRRSVLERAEEEGIDAKPTNCKKDSYAMGQLACVQVRLAQAGASPAQSFIKACASDSGIERIDKAAEMLRKILAAEPSNIYAANGLGVVFISRGRINEARQVFTQVREVSSSCDVATVNLAQLNAALGEHATAISLFDTMAKRAKSSSGSGSSAGSSSDVTALLSVMLLQARSHYAAAKLAECRAALFDAVTLQPASHAAWHNLGLALLAAARHPDGPDAPPRRVSEVEASRADANAAHQIFRSLNPSLVGEDAAAVETNGAAAQQLGAGGAALLFALETAASSGSAIEAAEAMGLTMGRRRMALRSCETVLQELEDEAERAAERDQRAAAEMAAADAKMAEYDAARQAAAEETAATIRAKEEAHAAAIREQKQRLAEKLEAWKEKDAAAEASGERRKRRRRSEHEQLAPEDEDEEAAGGDGGNVDVEEAVAEAALFGEDEADEEALVLGEAEKGDAAFGLLRETKRLRRGSAAAADEEKAAAAAAAETAVHSDEEEEGAAPAVKTGGAGRSLAQKRRKVIMDEDEEGET
jgi:hypothetical protein